MSEKMRYIELSETDNKIAINALNEFRKKRISEGRSTDDINQLLSRFINAPEKKHGLLSRER